MPIYEYSCEDCFHDFEVMQKVSDEPVKACPACGKERVKKLVSAPQFKLKGTGWYETDFKDKPKSSTTDKKSTEAQASTKKESSDTKQPTKKKAEKNKDS